MNLDRLAPLAIGLILVACLIGLLGYAAHALDHKVDSITQGAAQ